MTVSHSSVLASRLSWPPFLPPSLPLDLSHNITDGHVAHHLFFTQIPHYHLTAATAAVRQCLQPTGTYKKRRSWNFLARFTELNYRLKYVAGQGVLSYVDWEVREGGRAKE